MCPLTLKFLNQDLENDYSNLGSLLLEFMKYFFFFLLREHF